MGIDQWPWAAPGVPLPNMWMKLNWLLNLSTVVFEKENSDNVEDKLILKFEVLRNGLLT